MKKNFSDIQWNISLWKTSKLDQNPGFEFWFIIHLESCTLRASSPLSTINSFIGCYEGQMK